MGKSQEYSGQRARKPHKKSLDRIYDSVKKLLFENGYANLTLSAIAEDSGVSRSTLYRWFPSRTTVVQSFLRHQAEERVLRPDTGSLLSDISQLHRSYRRIVDEPHILIGLKGLCTEIPEESGFLHAFRKSYFQPRLEVLGEMLQRAQARGELLPGFDPELLFRPTMGAVFYSFFFESDILEVEKVVDRLAVMTECILSPYLTRGREPISSSLMT